MNYFYKLKEIKEMKITRKLQLEKQYEIDLELNKLKTTCPNIIIEYLLLQRHFSRIQQSEMINSSMINLFSTINKHFDENIKIYEDFNKILSYNSNYDKCEYLYKLLNT